MQPLELESDDDLTDSEESVYSGLEDSGSDSTNSSAAEEEEGEEDEGEQEEPSNGAAPAAPICMAPPLTRRLPPTARQLRSGSSDRTARSREPFCP